MNRTVVVIGGGYGGSLVAKALDSEADVTLIDPREAFVNAAASLRALTQPGLGTQRVLLVRRRCSNGDG